jgi:hypothetical protein
MLCRWSEVSCLLEQVTTPSGNFVDGVGAALPVMTVLVGNLTNLFGSIASPGAKGIASLSSVEEFHNEVSRLALILVYIGISVFVSAYIGSICWIITGERISRRIRMYIHLLCIYLIVVIIFALY